MHLAKFKGLELDPSKISESTTVKPYVLDENKQLFTEATESTPKFLLPRIEAIHEGRTRNYNRYLAEKLKGDASLKSGVYSWLHPYPKPVIYNHDIETEATGRVYNAAFSEFTKAGRKGIIVIPKITDPIAIQKVLDGRLLTVSIGATTDSAVCSYCGTDIIHEGWCGHEKGEVIDDMTVEWIAGNLYFNELSWVNEPADQDAMVIDPGQVSIAEAYAYNGREIYDLSKKRTEWVLTKELAISEGLLPEQKEEGDTDLKTVEELQAEVEQLTTALEQVTTEKSDLEAQLQTVAEALQTTQTELEAKTTEATDAVSAKEAAEGQVTELTQQVESLETERTGLVEANTQLASDVHKSLAERVVDIKVMLGKTTREGAVETHVARSTESLKDSLVDLLSETATFTAPRVVEKVDNPGSGVATGKETNSFVEGNKANGSGKAPEELTAEDVLARLFGSRTNKSQ